MTDWNLPREGGCRCGRLRFSISASPLATSACHCTGCQKMTGSAYSLTAMVPADGFVVTAGEAVIGGLRGPVSRHHFCPSCMSWVFTRIAGMDFVNVRPTMLDDPAGFEPFMETCTAERLPFAATGAVRSFEKFPPMEGIGALLRDYAEWAAARDLGQGGASS
ncbi:GFA family protein [Nitratireductor mangrovi]|uniref:GFA family protein n=1 Tax=Nitratireductor mangrovi TaxID=2599600 RepID=A0A5B8KXF0_9HYPH|nr:GFA family protein [Nitratireductor mangrovi]QDZ00242.1 GFA family protein [Nitratireductor mangrovi]